MKKTIITCVLSISLIVGCTTPPQTVTYNTLNGIQMTSKAAFEGYLQAVINKQVATNSVPLITQAYDSLQQAIVIATVADEQGTNGIAPANLVIMGTQFIALITPYLPTPTKTK